MNRSVGHPRREIATMRDTEQLLASIVPDSEKLLKEMAGLSDDWTPGQEIGMQSVLCLKVREAIDLLRTGYRLNVNL